jgi:ATP-dependent DNA helicase RecQ
MTWNRDLQEAIALQSWQRPLPDKPPLNISYEYATWRYLKALQESPSATADHVVLLRQVLRWAGLLHIRLNEPAADQMRLLQRAGIRRSADGVLRVTPYSPLWWQELAYLDDPPHAAVSNEAERAEPWLSIFPGHNYWRSRAQKEACWEAMMAPPGSTTLIALPTGAGKSLTFQLLSRFATGLTVVIVPTVALAMDHTISARRVFENVPHVGPTYYSADVAQSAATIEAVRNRACRLLFTSPEACVSGGLRPLLNEAAAQGWLENVVVDEAHIVESWGADFRVDFQLLSSAVGEWLSATHRRLRTYLLSATFSPECREALRQLFGHESPDYREYVAQRLRSEMLYYVQEFDAPEERTAAVIDCLYHLPRPAIVYTTEVNDATALFARLTVQEGFRRVGCFHGDTPTAERLRLLERWRGDEIDVMIATSAFGLGVDKDDVRTVVHACVPESVDRYYQEVGRGGRDGASVNCVFLPAQSDWTVASGLAPKLLGDEKLRLRWTAMWQGRQDAFEAGDHVFDLPLHVRRLGLLGARSSDENVRWNKRLLLLLARAGKVRVMGAPRRAFGEEGEREEWVRIEMRFSSTEDVAELVREHRNDELDRSAAALSRVRQYVTDGRAICRILQDHYGDETERACGSCPACRGGRSFPKPSEPLAIPAGKTTTPRLELVLNLPDFSSDAARDEIVVLLREVVRAGFQRFFCVRDAVSPVMTCFAEAFGETSSSLYRLDGVTADSQIRVAPEERVVCIHSGRYDRTLEVLNRVGAVVTHWVRRGGATLDGNGRLPLIADGATPYSDIAQWLGGVVRNRPRVVGSPI